MDYPIFKLVQSEAWEAFQKAAGRNVYACDLISGERALFIKFTLPLGRCRLLGMGIDFSRFTEGDFQNLIRAAEDMRCIHIRCEGYGGTLSSSLEIAAVTKSYLPTYTIKVALNADYETLLLQMKRKGRYNINVAQKEGVKVECFHGSDPDATEELDEFYSILQGTAKRDKFGIHPKEYYSKMLSALQDNALLYIARINGEAIAGIIVLYCEDEAVYYYGASSNEYRNLMAPYLLQWHAMKDAKAAGKEFYDFMGTAKPMAKGLSQGMPAKNIEFDKSDPLYGVSEFKQKFGGNLYMFNAPLDIVINPLAYKLFSLAKKLFRRG